MIVNIQLQVSGDNISTYDIYQNTDDFSAPLATGVTAIELQSNYSITADNSASVIRFVPDSGCANYKDIFINFNDTTPSITLVSDYKTLGADSRMKATTMATNNAGTIIMVHRGFTYFSLDNGTTWNYKTEYSADDSIAYAICTSNIEFKVMKSSGQYIRWYFDGTSWIPELMTHNIVGSILDFTIHNGVYYARTADSVYRSEDGSNFISVLGEGWGASTKKSIAGYGNTLYAGLGPKLFKSVDNGLNWIEKANTDTGSYPEFFDFLSLYVESESKLFIHAAGPGVGNDTQWFYSTDGADTINSSWLQPAYAGQTSKSNDIVKIGDVYYFIGSSNSISYTSDDLFTPTAGSVVIIPNTQTSGASAALADVYTVISIIGSENRFVCIRPENPFSTDFESFIWTGLISST